MKKEKNSKKRTFRVWVLLFFSVVMPWERDSKFLRNVRFFLENDVIENQGKQSTLIGLSWSHGDVVQLPKTKIEPN